MSWKHYIDKADIPDMEVLTYHILDHKTFDANLLNISYNNGEVVLHFDRELSSIEQAEVTGYVSEHVSTGYTTKEKFFIDTHREDGRLEKKEFYAEKDGDDYKKMCRIITYYYNDSDIMTHYVEEKVDFLGRVYRRKKRNLFSDFSSGRIFNDEEDEGSLDYQGAIND